MTGSYVSAGGSAGSASARRSLASALTALELELDEFAQEQLVAFSEMVVEWGKSRNLSGHGDVRSVIEKLVVGALSLFKVLEGLPGGSDWRHVTDLGSGAGFPGIPMAILRPRARVVLVESRERRHHFQRAVRRTLGIENIEPRLGRIESLVPVASDLVLAQAVAPPSWVVAHGLRWLAPDGLMVVPGGSEAPAPKFPVQEDSVESGIAFYTVPGFEANRSLWWGRRGRDSAESQNRP